jgi:peptidoglycan/xylan/chitin deacetylase (PgdA/CDA1 family)
MFNIMFETWSAGKAPAYAVQTTPLKPGTVDHSAISWSRYGGNVGVWRILRTLNRHGLKGTFIVNARCTEIFPEAVREIVTGGHDIAAHGDVQDSVLAYMSPEEERATIRACADTIEAATGRRPTGWLSPVLARSSHTHGILAEEGFLWHGEANDRDLPERVLINGKPMVAMPGPDFTDNRTLRSNPRNFFDVYHDTFDYLYKHEPMSLLVLGIHCHSGGRPLMVANLEALLTYFEGFPDVWFTHSAHLAQQLLDGAVTTSSYQARYFSALPRP